MTDQAKCGFVWYEHMTDDLDKAISFYTAVVGWEIRDTENSGKVVHGPVQVAGGSWILKAVDSQGERFALTAAT